MNNFETVKSLRTGIADATGEQGPWVSGPVEDSTPDSLAVRLSRGHELARVRGLSKERIAPLRALRPGIVAGLEAGAAD